MLGDYAEIGDLPGAVPFAECPSTLHHHGNDVSEEAKYLIAETFAIKWGHASWSTAFAEATMDHALVARLMANTEADPRFGELYVVSEEANQYLDPLAFGCGRNLPAIAVRQCGVMMATTILLAVSNGRGGGDFHGESDLIGSWGGTHVRITTELPFDAADVSEEIKSLIVEAEGGYMAEEITQWDKPGSVPSWL